jgi:spore germination protein GerM
LTKPVYRRFWFWIISVALLVVIGVGTWLFVSGRLLFQRRPPGPALTSGDMAAREAVSTEWIELYFSDARTGNLISESREIVALDDPADRSRMIIEELLAGPRRGLIATLPPTAHIREVFLDKTGGLYLNFSSEFVSDQPGGTATELAVVGSIMRTVAANIPRVTLVQLLVEGSEIRTINGHLRTDKPFLVSEWN